MSLPCSPTLSRISQTDRSDAIIISRGLGSVWVPDKSLIWFLEGHSMEVYFAERNGDNLFSSSPTAAMDYIWYLCNYIDVLLSLWKKVHLLGTSFGGFLSLKCAEEVGQKIQSVVALAPMIDPYPTFMERITEGADEDWLVQVHLSDETTFPVLRANAESLQWKKPGNIDAPSLVVWWSEDIFERREVVLEWFWRQSRLRIIQWVWHRETLQNQETWKAVRSFYGVILNP